MNNITTVSALGTVLGIVALASPATARQVDDAAGAGRATVVVSSPYAMPLAALGGQTLAQYLADHQANRPTSGSASCCTW